jgi:tetratricopeptide (TPR) repeat protein
MYRTYDALGELNPQAGLPRIWRYILLLLLFVFVSNVTLVAPAAAQSTETSCPDLRAFYPDDQVDWPLLNQQLQSLFPICLESTEFFALYGAAQLNNGNIAEASESLERALLLDPNNGAAQIDYAQALYLQGQLFSALDLNQSLLEREDLPANLQQIIQRRQRSWQALTTERSAELAMLAGYDNNLNGAPDSGQITLTLAGEPILLELNDEFRSKSGPYMNFRLGGRYRQHSALHQNNWQAEVRGRVSEDTESDLLQFAGQYTFVKPGRNRNWQMNAGVSHLQFGGSSLYTASDLGALYQRASTRACKPYYGLTVQHQLFNEQQQLNAIESKASVGLNCPLAGTSSSHQISTELSILRNNALDSSRPGGHRDGWEVNFNWLVSLPVGSLRSQLSHAQLNDTKGYSPLLVGGADRWLSRSYLLLQYRRPILDNLTFLVNLYHQNQRSNLELFRSVDSSVELGFSLAL